MGAKVGKTDLLGRIAVVPVSVIILAKNEEKFIERCISSVSWADEVIVVDSGSVDRTKEIAASLGAKVYEQEWLGWPKQRNLAISFAKNDWIFYLEADEIVTPELARSIMETMNGAVDDRNGYSVDRRGDFYGLLVPNMSRASKRLNFVRLFNRKYSKFDTTIRLHEEVLFPGKAIPLQGVLIHWRCYVMDEYISVFNRNATVEAEMLYEKGCRANGFTIFLRPILRFLWCYIARGGFRIGTRGFIYATVMATYEYIRYAKLWEMENGTPPMIHPPVNVYKDSPIARELTRADAFK